MQVDVQNTTVLSADGSSIKLGEYSGEVILIVNVASYCGNTAQYDDLQKLHDLYSRSEFFKTCKLTYKIPLSFPQTDHL